VTHGSMNKQKSISIVVPAFNEESSLPILIEDLEKELREYQHEIIVIDDGSSDSTLKTLLKIRKANKNLVVVKFIRNYGQTSAMDAGFARAKNDIVITMDADLQNPAGEIHKLIAEIGKGYDVVCGWRVNRLDSVGKKIMSRLAYGLRRFVIKDTLHDAGCTLKAYRREVLEGLYLFGEMHRFIHVLLKSRGCKVAEIQVAHSERRYGKTKYGVSRIFKGILDLIVVKFWLEYSSRPIYVFGGLGLGITSIGLAIGLYLTTLKVFFGEPLSSRPILLLAILLIVIGTQFVIFGLLADVMTKIYYNNSERKYYIVEKVYD